MSEISEPHLRDDVLAAYVDRTLAPTARAVADAHLADCASCRDDLYALVELTKTAAPPRPFLRIGAPLAAIAATLLVAVLGPWRAGQRTSDDRGERLRETTGVTGMTGHRLRAIAPLESATVALDSVRFTWYREARDAGYHLTVTDDSGTPQWTWDTPDTSIALPDSVRLVPGRMYYWYVDAIGGDGKTRATQLRHFRVAP